MLTIYLFGKRSHFCRRYHCKDTKVIPMHEFCQFSFSLSIQVLQHEQWAASISLSGCLGLFDIVFLIFVSISTKLFSCQVTTFYLISFTKKFSCFIFSSLDHPKDLSGNAIILTLKVHLFETLLQNLIRSSL